MVKKETHRKLTCVVDGGPGRPVQVNHLSTGIELVRGQCSPSPTSPSFALLAPVAELVLGRVVLWL